MTSARHLMLATALLVLLPLFFIGGPNAYSQRSFEGVWNLGHILFFAVFTVLIINRENATTRFLTASVIALGAATILGILIEWIQTESSRTADFHDLVRNTVGVMVALFFVLPSRRTLAAGTLRAFQVITVIALGFQTIPIVVDWTDEIIARRQFPVLSAFETPFERRRWEGGSRVIDRQEYFSGKASMRVTMAGESTPGVKLLYFPRDWSGYRFLRFSINNPTDKPASIVLRIKDREDDSTRSEAGGSADRQLMLASGWNTFTVSLKELMTSVGGRRIDLHRVVGIRFYMTGSVDPVTLFIDDVKLCGSDLEDRTRSIHETDMSLMGTSGGVVPEPAASS